MKKLFNCFFRNRFIVYDESENKTPWLTDLNRRNLKLLMFGQSDWNFYYDIDGDKVVSVVKKGVLSKRCNNWCFGSVADFSEFLRKRNY